MAIERAIAHDISSGYADDSFECYNSQDGRLRVWQVREGFRSLTELNKIALVGFINNLSISECGGCGWVVAGLGQEQGEITGGHRRDEVIAGSDIVHLKDVICIYTL